MKNKQTIKPAGIERDRDIAELRGDICCNNVGGVCYLYNGTCELGSIDCIKAYKPYSTDIACAMELDLPVNHYEVTRRGNKFKVRCWITIMPEGNTEESEWHETEAHAMADARSGAWLKFVESKK